MVDIPVGKWRRFHETSAAMECPRCGAWGTLLDHSIAPDGTVSPSVECVACGFHDHVKLVGWESGQ